MVPFLLADRETFDMAQEQQQRHQGNQGQQAQQPKLNLDPYENPIEYLRANGWKPLGIPSWTNCLWIDTTKPQFEKWEKVPAMGLFRESSPDGKSVVIKEKQVQQRIGNVAGHISEHPVFQTRYTPKQQPVTMQEALQEMMEREHRKQVEAELAAAKKKQEAAA